MVNGACPWRNVSSGSGGRNTGWMVSGGAMGAENSRRGFAFFLTLCTGAVVWSTVWGTLCVCIAVGE